MPVLYVDYEGGNDNYAGTSFSLLASGTDGRITSTTFSAATASFPNDGSLINQYLSIFNGSIYAVYRITAWISSTSLTIAAISGGTALADRAIDSQYYIGGRWRTFVNGATGVRIGAGDTIRAMASPDPTSLGINGTWTNGPLEPSKNITSSTGNPVSFTLPSHGYSTGDTVTINCNNQANRTGTFEITVTGANSFTLNGNIAGDASNPTGNVRKRNNTRVSLASSVTQNIECCGEFSNWTGAANVTPTLNITSFKEHRASQQIAVGAAFSTGLACYKTLPATLNLSGYQQVSFWINQTAGTATTATSINLTLCSDSVGVTTVNTIPIPALTLNRWIPITFNNAAALGSSINSIAFNVNTDAGAQTFLLDNIIACKASSEPDSLTLTSLIGKNTTGETWWPIQSINGTRVMLDGRDASNSVIPTSASSRGYYGPVGVATTATVTTFKRETINVLNNGLGGVFAPLNDTAEFSGGWDRTNMSSRTGQTWYDNRNVGAVCYQAPSTNTVISLTNLCATRFDTGMQISASGGSGVTVGITSCEFNGNGNAFQPLQGVASIATTSVFAVANNNGIRVGEGGNSSFASYNLTFNDITSNSNVTGISIANLATRGSTQLTFNSIKNSNNGTGIIFGESRNLLFTSCVFNGNTTAMNQSNTTNYGVNNTFKSFTCDTDIIVANPAGWRFEDSNLLSITGSTFSNVWASDIYCTNTTFSAATEVSGQMVDSDCRLYSHNHDNTIDNHRIFTDGGLISSAIDQRRTASGISWKMQPTSTVRSSFYPLSLSIAKIAVSANSLVTVKGWMRRDNTGLTMRLVCKGGQIAGVSTDVAASMTAAANTWEELSISFTPTQKGVVEITAEAFGGSTLTGWVDDLTITQV
jgi:hypothetical protein